MPSFGTAGVRGVFNVSQTPEQVYELALTCGFVFGRGSYGIGWDGRKSSFVLARAVASGIASAGSEAVTFGMVPTPVTAFGARQNRCRLGFSVTASHNPPEYSGVKIFNQAGMELPKEEEARVERAMVVDVNKTSRSMGALRSSETLEEYRTSLLSKFERVPRGLKIVVDCANGPGALVTPQVLAGLGHTVIPLNAQISWRFPARLPEPTPRTLVDTAAIVTAVGADLGFAHDGDADRLVTIDSSGRVVPDSLTSIMALRALGKSSGSVVLSENTSTAVEEDALALGLRVVRGRVGKTFAEIEREHAVFATEPSKIVDPDWGMWEDGMYGAALISDSIARSTGLLGLLNEEPVWHYRQVNAPAKIDTRSLLERAIAEFEKFRVAQVRQLDGLKIILKDGSWIMFRSSGTEPKTRIYCESRDQTRLQELLDVGQKLLGIHPDPGANRPR
jgi:phosphomannomutase